MKVYVYILLLLFIGLTSTCTYAATYRTLYDCEDANERYIDFPRPGNGNRCLKLKSLNERFYKDCVAIERKVAYLFQTGKCKKNGNFEIFNNKCTIQFNAEKETGYATLDDDEKCLQDLRKEIHLKYPNVKPYAPPVKW